MARVLFIHGIRRPHSPATIVKAMRVAFCNVCRADRILKHLCKWEGLDALTTGTCMSCGNTVSVDSTRPPENAA